jgi:hypothetical protein
MQTGAIFVTLDDNIAVNLHAMRRMLDGPHPFIPIIM